MVGHAKNCGCGCGCESGLMERPRYFSRQLVTPDDLNLQQEYFRRKLRLHNLMLHGWGVVCGAEVVRACKPKVAWKDPIVPEYEEWRVQIKPGYIIGPCGDDIWISCDQVYDVRSCGFLGAPGEPTEQGEDVWCSDVQNKLPGGTVYVAVRYRQITSRPVRSQPTGCGCDETECEYSRWRDCYQFCTLTDCPETHTESPNYNPFAGVNPTCANVCCDDPWVVLAEITLSEDGSQIESVNPGNCRRLVASFGHLWWSCDAGGNHIFHELGRGDLNQIDMYPLDKYEGLGNAAAKKQAIARLKRVGILSGRDVLKQAATSADRERLTKVRSGPSAKLLEAVVTRADLLRVNGVGPEYADLLAQAGVRAVQELAEADAVELVEKLAEKQKKSATRRMPAEDEVGSWIIAAKGLQPVVEFELADNNGTARRRGS